MEIWAITENGIKARRGISGKATNNYFSYGTKSIIWVRSHLEVIVNEKAVCNNTVGKYANTFWSEPDERKIISV